MAPSDERKPAKPIRRKPGGGKTPAGSAFDAAAQRDREGLEAFRRWNEDLTELEQWIAANVPLLPTPKNGLLIPDCIQEVLDSDLPDRVGKALQHIDGLPRRFKAKFRKYFDPEEIGQLRCLLSGLMKLRKGDVPEAVPNEEEFLVIACPDRGLRDLADGLRDAASMTPCGRHRAPTPPDIAAKLAALDEKSDLEWNDTEIALDAVWRSYGDPAFIQFMDAEIVEPLLEAAETLKEWELFSRDWAEKQVDKRYPDPSGFRRHRVCDESCCREP